ncbi:MAG: helical backbone metal receptor [Candidatus Palauibacterales bacterium]|jgi:ABC-type Fe3+-hydroxamate transport system substrate-binding protein|nr:helical backbone metal receptor [Candidatus Palauibacterales bacterium]
MRIVSLCPSLTELVFDLGVGDELVGVTKFCVHPAEGLREIEKVGGTKTPKIDRIVELSPDLVLLNEEENRLEDAEALRAAGVACHSSFPKTAIDTAAMVRSIGKAVRRPHEAERISRAIEEAARRVREASEGRPPVSYAYLIWRQPLMSVSEDTFISDLLSLAGGMNVFAGRPKRYPVVEPEEIAAAGPDAVLLSTEPFPFQERHIDEISRATGLAPEIFHIVDGEMLSWHGSRTPAGIDCAAQVMERVRGRMRSGE